MFRSLPRILTWGGFALGVLAFTAPLRASEMEPLDCVTAPARIVEVAGARSGLLDGVFVDRGDRVTRGMTIATLESTVEAATVRLARIRSTMRGEVASQEVNLRFDHRKQHRVTALHAGNAISEQVKEDAERDSALAGASLLHAREKRRVARVELERAEAVLRQRTVIAPLAGVVTHRFRSAGEYVEDQPIVRIAQLDPLHVELLAPVALAGLIRPGMSVDLSLEAADPGGVTGVVVITDPVADAASGTFGVRIRVPNPDHRLMAGLKCQATIRPGVVAEHAPALPGKATVTSRSTPRAAPASSPDLGVAAAPDPEPVVTPVKVPVTPPTAVASARAPASSNAGPAPESGFANAPAPWCATLGPFDDRHRARTLADSLKTRGMTVVLRAEGVAKPTSYIVLAGPGRDLAETRRIAADLRQRGVRDMQIMYRGDFARHVSLGVYPDTEYAEYRRARLARKGIQTTIRPRGVSGTGTWLDLATGHGPADLRTLEHRVRTVDPGAKARIRRCTTPVSPPVTTAELVG